MIRPSRLTPIVALVLVVVARAAAPSVVEVAPSELTRRPDLIGREIVVDDRIASFQYREGQIRLARSPVLFRLLPRLRFEQTPRDSAAARLQGVLKREGDRWVCDVTALELFPDDLERLTRAEATLPPGDADGRFAWARWAEQRGRAFQDEDLLARGRALESEALRIEAERPSPDPAAHLLELAHRARSHHVPEPEPSALAHRAFRARLESSRTAEALQALVAEIAAFFPKAAEQVPDGSDPGGWQGAYAQDPAAYRAAPAPVRAALDHQLWADALQRLLERQAADAPREALTLAEQAEARLPERPALAARLREQALQSATRDLASLRQRDVEELATIYREKLGQPERAQALIRDWLDSQRRRLSPTDAEGHVALAGLYESRLNDPSTAKDLLQAAWRIDPQSKTVADAFRRRGFRKVNDTWVEPERAGIGADTPATEVALPRDRDDTLLGKTPREVRTRLGGKPNRIVRSASREQVIEQWIYVGATHVQYINFLHNAGAPVPQVVAYYSRPRTAFDAR